MDLKKKMKAFFTLDRHANDGFTLVELIVVIAILAILAGIAVPAYSGYVDKAKMAADQQMLATMNTAFTVACMDNGEYDMTNLSFSPVASNIQTAVTVNSEVNTEFQTYFGGGAFQYYDVLRFDSSKGVFVANTVAAIKEALKNAWEGSTFGAAADGGEGVLKTLLGTFDGIGSLFADGFSLDTLVSKAPDAVAAAFGFGTFDLTDEQILEKYDPNCAGKTPEEIAAYRATLTDDQMNTIKGNAYVMRFAENAAGKTGEIVMGDVNKFVNAIQNPASEDEVIAYYKEIYGEDVDYNTAAAALELGYGINAGAVVALANSGVKNDSGISALGSMYALAAGYFNSNYYKESEYFLQTGETVEQLNPTYSEFETFMTIVNNPEYFNNFQDYCTNQGAADVDAYLDFMSYLSTSDVDITSSGAFGGADGQFTDIWEVLGNK